MTDSYPAATDLLRAVSECLRSDIAPALTDKALQFKLKIAENVLAIVRREIEQGSENAQRENAILAALLGEQGSSAQLSRQLSSAIAAGAFDDRAEELLPALEAISLGQLAIDNPDYSSYQALIKETSVL